MDNTSLKATTDRSDILCKIEVFKSCLEVMKTMSLLTPTSEPSICIPRVFSNIDKTLVKSVFEQLFGPGCIERIDMIQKTTGRSEKFQRVFVHFKYWPVTRRNQSVRQRLIDGHQLKIVYDDPWFWKCSASRIPKPQGKATIPYIDGVCETDDPAGKKIEDGEENDKRGDDKRGDDKRGDDNRDNKRGDDNRDNKRGDDNRGDDNRGDDNRDKRGDDGETRWRHVNKTRGKKNRRRENVAGKPLRKVLAPAIRETD